MANRAEMRFMQEHIALRIGIYLLLKEYAAPLLSGLIPGGPGKAAEQFVLILYITAGAPVIINGLNSVGKMLKTPEKTK